MLRIRLLFGGDDHAGGGRIRYVYVTLLIARLVSHYSSKSLLEAVSREEIAGNKRIASGTSQANSNNPEQ
jgi:hypothetical protein